MSMSALDPRTGMSLGWRLASVFAQALVWYFFIMAGMWCLGIEALYGHPTPFYAYFAPVALSSSSVTVVSGVVLAAIYAFKRGQGDAAPGRTNTRRWLVIACVWAALVASYGIWHSWGTDVPDDSTVSSPTAAHVACLLSVLFLFAVLYVLDQMEGGLDAPGKKARRLLLVFLVAFAVAFPIAVSTVRGGMDGLTTAYQRERMEYVGDIGTGGSISGLFRDYNKLHDMLSMHSKVHPPGPVAIMWLLSFFTLSREALPLSIATVVFGALAVVPLYLWARDVAGERAALATALAYVLMPSIVLFSATSADITFMPFTVGTLFLFWRAIERRSVGYALAAGAGYACMSLISYSLLTVGAFFGFVGLWKLGGRGSRLAVIQTAAAMGLSFLCVHAIVRWGTGFDVIENFRLSKAQFDFDQFHLDKQTPRYPAWTWRLFNPAAWFYFAGIPASLLFIWRIARPRPQTRGLTVVFGLTLLVLTVLYLARGEGERSAMYILPFVALLAGDKLSELREQTHSWAPHIAVGAFLSFQCWLTEVLFFTYW